MLMILGVSCIDLENPYQNPENADLVILSAESNFSDDSRLRLYSAYHLTVAPVIYEQVDSIVVQASHNRLWRRTKLAQPEPGEYRLQFSFSDTGYQIIDIKLYRNNTAPIHRAIRVYVYSPLDQPDMSIPVGEICSLSTPPVGDQVTYHWELTDSLANRRELLATVPSVTYEGRSFIGVVRGALWVTDSLDSFPSPVDSFTVHFTDGESPVITAVSGMVVGDTVITGDRDFYFKAGVFDNGALRTVVINGAGADSLGESLYARLFTNMPGYDPDAAVSVIAEDKAGNRTTRSFYLRYDTEGPRSKAILSTVWPDSVTAQRLLPIIGTVANLNPGDTIVVSATAGDSLRTDTVIAEDGPSPWHMSMPLADGRNSIRVIAYDTKHNAVSDTDSAIVILDRGAADAEAPNIREVLVESRSVSGQSEAALYVDSAQPTIAVYAFDNGSGMAHVRIGFQDSEHYLHNSRDDSYFWEGVLSGVDYTAEPVTVTAVDNEGNTASDTFTVLRNRIPEIHASSDIPDTLTLVADSAYAFSLILVNIDDDSTTVALHDKPSAMELHQSDQLGAWTVRWTPTLEDSGEISIDVVVSDILSTQTYQWPLRVVAHHEPVAAPASDFYLLHTSVPDTIIARQDTMAVTVRFVGGAAPYQLTAALEDRDATPLFDSVSRASEVTVRWVPDTIDEGEQRLLFAGRDSTGAVDTVRPYPALTVLPANRHACSLIVTDSENQPIASGAHLDLTMHDAAKTLRFIIEDGDAPQTEMYIRTIERGGITEYDTLRDRRFSMRLDTLSNNPYEPMTITVTDRTGSSDSVHFSIRYFYQQPDDIPSLAGWMDPVSGIELKPDPNDSLAVKSWANRAFPVTSLSVFELVTSLDKWPFLRNGDPAGAASLSFKETAWLTSGSSDACFRNWSLRPFTIFAVIRYRPVESDALQTLISTGSSSHVSLGTVGDTLAVFTPDQRYTTDLLAAPDEWQIVMFQSYGAQRDPFTVSVARNGEFSTREPGPVNGNGEGSFVLGSSNFAGAANGWSGDLAETLYYARYLSAADIKEAHAYLQRKYGISAR